MNILVKKHSSILKKNSAKRRCLITLLNKKITNKILKITFKSNNNLLIKTICTNFSTQENLEKNINKINILSNNPSVEKSKSEFNLILNEEQKINFGVFYENMKENVDLLVEMNKKLKEKNSNM
jgi:hypothetical protein